MKAFYSAISYIYIGKLGKNNREIFAHDSLGNIRTVIDQSIS